MVLSQTGNSRRTSAFGVSSSRESLKLLFEWRHLTHVNSITADDSLKVYGNCEYVGDVRLPDDDITGRAGRFMFTEDHTQLQVRQCSINITTCSLFSTWQIS